jgi:succinate dehydrogenase / fumarate reductase cytochrome b subunit
MSTTSSTKFLESSIGKKLLMGLTGLFLISFLVVHATLNSFIFAMDGGILFNQGALFMATNPVIRIMEIVLFIGLILHMVQALILSLANQKARPVKYVVDGGKANSKWYARSMGILGSLLLMFLVVHLSHFWIDTKAAQLNGTIHEHNTYTEIIEVFRNPLLVLVYLLGVISLGYHLAHGFQSSFQTLGLNHPKYTPVIKNIGLCFSIIITVVFASMPLAVYFGCVK